MPRLYIISGPNGSGKTTASYSVLPELLDCSEFVNSDEFAKHLSPFSPESAYITASRLMLRKVQYLFDRREDFCIETTLATRSLLKMARSAQRKGYYVTVLYFWLNSPDIAVPEESVVMLPTTVPFREMSKTTPARGVPYTASVLMILIRPLP